MKLRNTISSSFARSAFVKALACMFLVYLIVASAPLKSFLRSDETYGSQLISKVADFLSSDSNPDIILIGSSLILSPAISCDRALTPNKLSGKKPKYHEYDKAQFLESLLQEQTGRKHEIYNLALPAAMMSDQCLLLEEALACGKKPAVVVFSLAPRDFVANTVPKPEASPIAKEVARIRIDRLPNSSPAVVFEKISLNWTRHTESLQQKITGARSILQSQVVALLTPSSGKPAIGKKEQTVEKIRDCYHWAHNPYNPAIFETQWPYLKTALSHARDNSIASLVINMPLGEDNKAQLVPEAMQKYLKTLDRLSGEFSVPYMNIGVTSAQNYSFDDFEDSVHLGVSGGKKFFAALAKQLAEEPGLSRKLLTSAP